MILRSINRLTIKSLLILFSTFAGLVYSEPIQVQVAEVTDTRSTGQFYSGCEIELKIVGDEVANSFGIKDVKIINAIDNLGRDLINEDNSNDLFFNANTEGKSVLSKKIKLKNPRRSATLISLLEGSVELFKPTIENGGKIIVNNYLREPGLLIHEDVLQKLDLELMYLTKEVYEQNRELYKNAHNNEMDRIGEKTDDPFADLFKGFFGSSFMNEQNSLKFYVKDKNNRLVDLQFLDKNDKLIETWGRSSMGSLRTYSFRDSLPGSESKLVIYVATDKSVLNVNFKIDDISLP